MSRGPSHDDSHALDVYGSIAYVSTTKYPKVRPEFEEARQLVLAMKLGDTNAIQACAKVMARHPTLRGFRGIVSPAPRSTAERTPHVLLAKLLVSHGVGTEVKSVIKRISPVPSSRILRQQGLEGIPYEKHVATMGADPEVATTQVPILLIDDVFTEGNTLRASATVIRRAGFLGTIISATAGYSVLTLAGSPYTPKHFMV